MNASACKPVRSIVMLVTLAATLAPAPGAAAQCPAWSNVTQSAAPPARNFHALCYDSNRGVTVLFGGFNPTYLSDLWEGDQGGWSLRSTGGPGPRAGHAMAYDSKRGVVVVYGGYDGFQTVGDTWEWNGATGQWAFRSGSGPAPRYQSVMTYDENRGVCVLNGGYIGNYQHFTETWEWNGSTGQWTLRSGGGPSGRSLSGFTYDADRHVCVLFGGFNSTVGYTDELWEWNGAAGTWTQRTPIGPAPVGRYGCGLAFDSARHVTVMHGGYTNTLIFANDTWQWDGALGAWTQLSPSSPPVARREFSMVYDSRRAVCVLFGGQTGGSFATLSNQTCELASGLPVFNPQPQSASVTTGQAVSLYAFANSVSPVGYQWRKGGLLLTDGGRISGANTPTLTINPAVSGDSGSYDLLATNACGIIASRPAVLAVTGAGSFCPGDANGSGTVTFADITAVLANFGIPCP